MSDAESRDIRRPSPIISNYSPSLHRIIPRIRPTVATNSTLLQTLHILSKCCQKSSFLHCSSFKPVSFWPTILREERASASTPVVCWFDNPPARQAPLCVRTIQAVAISAQPVGTGRAITIPYAKVHPATAARSACPACAVISDTFATRARNFARRTLAVIPP